MIVSTDRGADVRKPRLLLAFHSTRQGGAERMGVAELAALRQDFEVLASAPTGPLASEIEALGPRLPGLSIVPLWGAGPSDWLLAVCRTVIDARRFARVLAHEQIDVVMTNSATCLAAVLGAWRAGVPVIVRARDWPASRSSRSVFRIEARLATAIFAVSAGLGALFPGQRTRTVPDGVRVQPEPVVRRPLQAPFELLQVGGLDPRKRQDLALRALALLRDDGLDVGLTLAGRATDAAFTQSLRRLTTALGLDDHVRFAGEQTSLDEEYAKADLAISPAQGEWTPLWLMEAMSRGIPVVAVETGSVADIVVPDRTGLIAEATPHGLAVAISALLRDPKRANALGRAGAAHVRDQYDQRSALARLCESTQDVLRAIPQWGFPTEAVGDDLSARSHTLS